MTKLRELRLESLLTIGQMAKETGLAKSTIINLELGRSKPQPVTIRKLAKVLKVDPSKIEF